MTHYPIMNANLKNNYIQEGGARFDVLKFILAMVILTMHAGFFPRFLLPIARLAVPLFFLMTSYFFHLKLSETKESKERRKRLAKFVKRNIQLYLFWSLLLLPAIVLLHLSWFQNGFGFACNKILKSFLLTGFFPASWFILASIYAVLIVYGLSKYLNNRWLFVIVIPIYVLALLDSNYGGLLSDKARSVLTYLDVSFYKSIPAALVWVVIGKILAENKRRFSNSVLCPAIILFFILYYVEFFIIEHFGWSLHTDCFIMSIPLVTLLFIAIGQSEDVQCRQALWLRKSSIIVYCLHFTVIRVFKNAFEYFNNEANVLFVFSFALFFCLFTSFIIIKLCEQNDVKLLRYAY